MTEDIEKGEVLNPFFPSECNSKTGLQESQAPEILRKD